MKIRQTVKKAVALGTGALMLGATIMGAAATNLSEYPTVFVKDGKVNAKIVVGEKAQTIDVVGAIDIAADLQAAAVSKETVTVAGSGITVTGGKTKEIALDGALSPFTTLNNADIAALKDEKITWNDKDIDVEESVNVDGMEVSASAQDADFGAKVYLTTPDVDAIKYRYTMDDNDLNISLVDDENPLKVEILGKAVEIISVGADEITMSVANEYYLAVGDSIDMDGKKVTLKNVGSSAVVVDVDGVIATVEKTTPATSEKVNDVRVELVSAFDANAPADRSATLKIGDKITETVELNDPMTLFGEVDDSSDAEWVWFIDADATTDESVLVVGADFNQRYDKIEKAVKAVGEKYTLPNNYASIYIDSVTATADVTIDASILTEDVVIDVNEDGTDYADTLGEYLNAVKLVASKDVFTVTVGAENESVEVVYLIATNDSAVTLAVENSDGDIQLASDGGAETFWVDYEDTDMTVTYDNATIENVAVNFAGDIDATNTSATITLGANLTGTEPRFGATVADYEAGVDVVFAGVTVDKDLDYMTSWGNVISATEDGFDNDEFQMTIPSEQVKANVVVVGKAGSTSGASGSVTTDKVNAIGVDFGVLDKDFTAGSADSIVVGGPCVNTAAAKLMGNPSDCAAGFAAGEATLGFFADGSKVALLVAGYSGEDTLGATRALVTGTLPAKSSAKVITTNYKTPSIQ